MFCGHSGPLRHCDERSDRSNPFFLSVAAWIASRSLSSGARSRDPLARNDARLFHLLFPGAARLFYSVIARSAATKQSILSFCSGMDCFAALAMTWAAAGLDLLSPGDRLDHALVQFVPDQNLTASAFFRTNRPCYSVIARSAATEAIHSF